MRVSSLLRGCEAHVSAFRSIHRPCRSRDQGQKDPENARHTSEKVVFRKKHPRPCTLSGMGYSEAVIWLGPMPAEPLPPLRQEDTVAIELPAVRILIV